MSSFVCPQAKRLFDNDKDMFDAMELWVALASGKVRLPMSWNEDVVIPLLKTDAPGAARDDEDVVTPLLKADAPGSARVPMPPAGPPPMQHIQESREYAQRCIGKTRGGDRDGRTRIAPGSARARMQASPQPEYQALARAQREAGDSHRLWLDRKYKKRAWKRAWKRQARNVPPPVICLHVIHTIRREEPRGDNRDQALPVSNGESHGVSYQINAILALIGK